jgi:DNA-binding HxlR family transcriptional regulator
LLLNVEMLSKTKVTRQGSSRRVARPPTPSTGKDSAQRRSYRQFCGGARALDVVGERWTLLIVRNLLLGPRRYSDLLQELPGITTNLLAKRLRELSASGIVRRETLGAPLRAEVYALTPRGQALEPVLLELARWGGALMDRPRRGDVLNPGWALLSLKNRYQGGLDLELELRVDGRTFELLCLPRSLRIQERAATRPAAVATLSYMALARLLFGGEPLPVLRRQGAIAVEGDASALQEMLDALAG